MRSAIIGVSHWHAPRLAASFRRAGCRIVAGSDPDPAALEAFRRAECVRAHADHRALLERERLDFVVVLGTPLEMPVYVLDVLEAGLPLAVEKPLAVNASALEPITVAARGRFVAVALVNRHAGIWGALHRLETSNRAGERHHASFRLVNGFPERYARDGVGWVLDPDVSGGGALRNLGIHGVDAFLEFAGGEPVEVEHALLSARVHRRGVEEYALLTLRSASGIVGAVEAGYTYPTLGDGGDYEWRLGTRNACLIERSLPGNTTTLESHVLEEHPAWLETTALGQRYDAFAQDTIERLKAGDSPRATLEDLRRAMQVIDRAYALAGSGA